jgi:GNAT superfamily N-acetyltransferase
MEHVLRRATMDDRALLEVLIAQSARGLSRSDYTEAQLDAALGNVFGVDTQLIRDGTYFVAEVQGELAGCGGWSLRKTLFGADQGTAREPERLDPEHDAARIRAFFVHPSWARLGIGKALLERCEAEAKAAGFRTAELMATLPGRRLYQAMGYRGTAPVAIDLGGGLSMECEPMRKALT